jgi:hypothetical protein
VPKHSPFAWRLAVLVAGALVGAPVVADTLLDFSVFEPPQTAQRKLPDPVVSWLVKPNAAAYCQQVQAKDGFVSRPEGCVFWQLQASRCTIVTTGQTTHSQLGHLFVHCLQTR